MRRSLTVILLAGVFGCVAGPPPERATAPEQDRIAVTIEGDRGAAYDRVLAVFVDGTDEERHFTSDQHGDAFDLGNQPHFLSPEALISRLKRSYLWMSGNTVLARRDALIDAGGYPSELEWHSEWFIYYVLALRYGACVIPETLAMMREVPATYSRSGMADAERQRKVLTALARRIKSPGYGDIARIFRTRPCLFSPFQRQMLRVLAARPQFWDLFMPYLGWTLRHHSRMRIAILKYRFHSMQSRVAARAASRKAARR